jgi:hypothetical protein
MVYGNVKIVMGMSCENLNWKIKAQNTGQCPAVMNKAIHIEVPYNTANWTRILHSEALLWPTKFVFKI